ncbi:hypothetical protein [Sutcliffiella rhizosphaerae]|uniref:Polymer-forming cytoskeletal protein n=1 Tax=Sutcliffiella rhizosphaerae TaxID=2880967 RepID=A0ABN8AEI2_9BACI|nr:hypothetical protein [Sutcliffiella rhizosphaerae]CAG9623683.1 hypothetical protein BACCIP111883_04515 [Sutcliffiella rhizosphaerae]
MEELQSNNNNKRICIKGGTYSTLSITDSHYTDGDLDVNVVFVDSKREVNSNIKCKDILVEKNAHINGSIECNKGSFHGTTLVNGDISSFNIMAKGNFQCTGKLNSTHISLIGTAKVEKNILSETLNIIGDVSIEDICVSRFKFVLNQESTARNIKGDYIQVIKGINSETKMFFEVEKIEGKVIYIENTLAQVIIGDEVIVGSGCLIEIVYCNKLVIKDDSSKISTKREKSEYTSFT